jgi:2-amino-4-hydroxy-6-hydroxymethyldihydropteridine diphosphokinase
MALIYIGIGSNLGDRDGNCRKAVELLPSKGITVKKVSSLYTTVPWGVKDQPDFANMAVEAETWLIPHELLRKLKEIEKEMGRAGGERWGPRVIDLDLLFYDDIIVSTNELTVPHPLIQQREFVLLPMAEIASSFVHPVMKKTIRQLAENLKKGEIG